MAKNPITRGAARSWEPQECPGLGSDGADALCPEKELLRPHPLSEAGMQGAFWSMDSELGGNAGPPSCSPTQGIDGAQNLIGHLTATPGRT